MQRFIIPVVVAVVLIAGQAYLQGVWTERWSHHEVSGEIQAFADRMNNIPTTLEIGKASTRRFRSAKRRRLVRSIVIRGGLLIDLTRPRSWTSFWCAGHSRDITMHTPDQCYVLSGFEESEDAQTYSIDTGDKTKMSADFMTNRFRKSHSILPQDLRIFWSFSGDGEWVSPSVPKYSLSHFPALYKVYANTSLHGESKSRPEDSAAVPFLREFMPVLNAVLFPKENKPEGGDANKASAGAADADKTRQHDGSWGLTALSVFLCCAFSSQSGSVLGGQERATTGHDQPGSEESVRETGLEPARYCYHQALNLARLPIPPFPQNRTF